MSTEVLETRASITSSSHADTGIGLAVLEKPHSFAHPLDPDAAPNWVALK